MNYEQLLEEAYENVEQCEECERFEMMKVKGHHEGTKTIIANFEKIASHLRRKPEHIIKYLTKELASSANTSGERLILSRKLPSKTINEKIEKYANEYVICNKCGKPDTEILNEGEKAVLKCLACGNKKPVHKI